MKTLFPEGCDNMDTSTFWPSKLPDSAYIGVLGDIVKTIEPHTEADPMALYSQLIVMVGNVVGRNPHFVAESDRHGLNLFATLVGESSKGRKGTSWGYIRTIAEEIDPNWKENHLKSGLCSGEGLVWAIRDDQIEDPSTTNDKRLLSEESEFASVVKVLSREGNTLSAILRNAWDGKDLQTITKNSPAIARNPHISIIGHITKRELLKYFKETEAANGFGNRFLWVCTKRSRLLPDGGKLDPANLKFSTDLLRSQISKAKDIGHIRRSPEASTFWREKYEELSHGHLGVFGAVTGRAEPQIMRIATLFAALEHNPEISLEQLKAAYEIWKYCERSAKYIFGLSTGDEVADKILTLTENSTHGVTRTEIRDLFNKNKSKTVIDQALHLLKEQKLIKKTTKPTKGKPVEIWFYTGGDNG